MSLILNIISYLKLTLGPHPGAFIVNVSRDLVEDYVEMVKVMKENDIEKGKYFLL